MGQVFADEAVKEHAQHVLLKIPTIHTAPKVVGYLPNSAIKLGAFLFCGVVAGHNN